MKPTDVNNPDYYHQVVDCQWACPAHTDVPEYIRLIALGRYSDAYMVNRESNVFPGILGRTCDRPCEPACRRGRLDEKPVAICRLKRVAADLRGEIKDRLPSAPKKNNGKRVALVGAGPASLTVANDLRPLGYEVVIFEKNDKPGGLMRTNIPSFRLPAEVLDEEINYILDMGVDLRLGTPVSSMKDLLSQGFDAVFVGSGAPRGKNLVLPGRDQAADQIHIGIEWLESVAFGHTTKIQPRVLVIGVGNTAMDCCRTARRLGGQEIKVMARKSRRDFKASEWELEDAEHEKIEIVENHAPKEFLVKNGKLVGMKFTQVEWSKDPKGQWTSKDLREVDIPCDVVILAVGQDNAFPWIERDLGIEFDKWEVPQVDKVTYESTRAGVFFGGDAAFGPKNIIWAVAHGHEAAISIHQFCQGLSVKERPPAGLFLSSVKMGYHEWSYKNNFDPNRRTAMPEVALEERLKSLETEVELGFDEKLALREAQRCLNCDIQTHFTDKLCIECDACIDICPAECLSITANAEENELRQKLTAPAQNLSQSLFVSESLPQTKRVMVKDENVCVHCGLCAEKCPTAAWDMKKSWIKMPYLGKTT